LIVVSTRNFSLFLKLAQEVIMKTLWVMKGKKSGQPLLISVGNTGQATSFAVICRKLMMSRKGELPKRRLYSRLNWEGLS